MDIRRPILYKSARRCGRIPIHVQAQEHERGICELWLSGEKTAAPLSLQDFRPVLLPRDVASPSPCAYFPHFYRALLIFTLPFCWVFDSRSRCTLPVNLGLCRFRKKKKKLGLCLSHCEAAARCSARKKRRQPCKGSGNTAASACAPVGCSRPVLFRGNVLYILSTVVTLPRPVVASIIQLLIGSRFASSEGRMHDFFL
jgi:hypothetical protein